MGAPHALPARQGPEKSSPTACILATWKVLLPEVMLKSMCNIGMMFLGI